MFMFFPIFLSNKLTVIVVVVVVFIALLFHLNICFYPLY